MLAYRRDGQRMGIRDKGALILISALRKWSELWKLRQQPEFRVAEATAS